MATDKNFVVKNGLTINGSEIITSAGNLTNVGSIATTGITVDSRLVLDGSKIYDNSTNGNSKGFRIGGAGLVPLNGVGTDINNVVDIGTATYKFKDLYLSGTISSGEITTTAPQFKYVSNTDSNVGLLIRDETYVSNEADITASRLAAGNNLTLGLAGQVGINAYIGGVNKFSLNSSGNATFAGTINSGAITTSGLITGDRFLSGLGTAASPAYKVGDSDSGFYDSGANVIGVTLGGVLEYEFKPTELDLKTNALKTGLITVEGNLLDDQTMINIIQTNAASDISTQESFIDFTFIDSNANNYPQVKIGAQVGQNADADSQLKEGSGAFVVHTNNATTADAGGQSGMAERMRVDYQGHLGLGINNPAFRLHAYHSNTNVVARFESGDGQVYIDLHDSNSGTYGALLGHSSTKLFHVADASVADKLVLDNSGSLTLSGDFLKINDSGSQAFGVFKEKTITGSGTSNDLCLFAESITNGGEIHFMTGGSATKRVTINSSGNVGINNTNPQTKLHIEGNNVGIPTNYGGVVYEAVDAQIDVVSDSSGTWGSAINFVEGASSTANTDVWSIARKTTGGSGDSSLNFNFGTGNQHDNTARVIFSSAGNVGMASGHSSGKFAVMNSSVHGSYDFYNNGTTYLNGATTIDANLTVTGYATITSDTFTKIYSSTNGASSGLTFSDAAGSSYGQAGNIKYVHQDTLSYGSANAFILESSESSLTVLADGKLMFDEGLYLKPSSGTGAGTKIIDSTGYGVFINGNIDPDSFTSYAGGIGNIADGGGWAARGLFVHGGGTGDAAAIAHNGANLYFGIQNGSAANSMSTYMTVTPAKAISMTDAASVALPTTTCSGNFTISGGHIYMSNLNIYDINTLTFNDPGPNEGISWDGGNTKIYESPDDLTTNTAGNLQFVYGSTRRLTVNSTGIDVNNTITTTYVDAETLKANDSGTTPGSCKLHVGSVLSAGSSAVAQLGGFIRMSDQLIIHSGTSANTVFVKYNGGNIDLTEGEGSGANPDTVVNALKINASTVINSSRAINNVTGLSFSDGNVSFDSSDANGYPRFTGADASAQLALFRSGSSAGGMYIGGDAAGLEIRNSSIAVRASLSQTGVFNVINSYQINGTTVIDSSRNLTNIGTQSMIGNLYMNKSQPWVIISNTTEDGGGVVFTDNQADSAGTAGPGSSSQAFRMTYHCGNETLIMGHDDDSYAGFNFGKGGALTCSGNVTAYSDERLKDNIQTLDGKKALQMRGVSFTKNGEEGSGVIAQELEKVAPELVTTDKVDGIKSVAYGNLVGYLIEAIKEQQKQIEELKEEVSSLRSKN